MSWPLFPLKSPVCPYNHLDTPEAREVWKRSPLGPEHPEVSKPDALDT